jgi:hypothetical protein
MIPPRLVLFYYRLLSHHRFLAERRSPLFASNRAAKWTMAATGLLLVAYLVFIAVLMALSIKDERGHTALEFFMGISVFVMIADFLGRFFLQNTPSHLVKPYVLLPIPTHVLINSFVLRSLFSPACVIWLFLFLPYCLMAVVFPYGFVPALSFLLLWWILIMVDSQWYAIVRTLVIGNMLWWLLSIAVGVLLFLPWLLSGNIDHMMDFYASIGSFLDEGSFQPHLAALALLILLIVINSKIQYHAVWTELTKQERQTFHTLTGLAALNKYGLVGEYLKLEVRSLLRNKGPKKLFLSATAIVVFISLLITLSTVYDDAFMTNFWCIYDFIVYGGMLLTRTMSYERNYVSCLMVHKESLLSLLTAKYYFACLLMVVPFVMMLPMIVIGKWSLLMVMSYAVFTAGVQYFLLMQIAVYNKQRLPLNEKFIGNSNTNYVIMLLMILAFVIPMFLINILQSALTERVSWCVMMAIGGGFIATHHLWIKNIYNRIMKNKYSLTEVADA